MTMTAQLQQFNLLYWQPRSKKMVYSLKDQTKRVAVFAVCGPEQLQRTDHRKGSTSKANLQVDSMENLRLIIEDIFFKGRQIHESSKLCPSIISDITFSHIICTLKTT